MKMTISQAVKVINKKGILLVFPIKNKKDPESLWSNFFPKTKMRWEWDESGDNRVGELWHLRAELSASSKVIYSKWFQGRATFFSKNIFEALMKILKTTEISDLKLSRQSLEILEILEMDSPLSTKELKSAADLKGKFYEPQYNRALKTLWQRLLIVGFGEKKDGAFPSLAMGATKNLFESNYLGSKSLTLEQAHERVNDIIAPDSPFLKFIQKINQT
jgi:hypothetical protein